MKCGREVDGYNPYVQFENGTFIAAQAAKFCSQDAQATQTSKHAKRNHLQHACILQVAVVTPR